MRITTTVTADTFCMYLTRFSGFDSATAIDKTSTAANAAEEKVDLRCEATPAIIVVVVAYVKTFIL